MDCRTDVCTWHIVMKSLLLDTLPFLQSAVHMYKKWGFYEIPRYNDSPIDTAIYMKLDL